MTFLILFTSISGSYAAPIKANEFVPTMQELITGVGTVGLVGFKSVGAAILGPLLIGAAVAGTGYIIYKNKDLIYRKFNEWYSSASSAMREWFDQTASNIENGVITDMDTIDIPIEYYTETQNFIKHNWENFGSLLVLNELYATTANVSPFIQDEKLYNYVRVSSYSSTAPVAIFYNNTVPNISVSFSRDINKNIVAVIPVHFVNSSSVGYSLYYLSDSDIVNGLLPVTYDELHRTRYSYRRMITTSGTASGGTRSGPLLLTFPSYTIDGSRITFGGDGIMDFVLPVDGKIMISNKAMEIYANDNFVTAPNVMDFTVISNDSAVSTDVFSKSVSLYNPLDDVIEVELTPDVVNTLNDYIVRQKVNELDLVSSIDISNVVPNIDDKEDTGVVDSIIDFLTSPLESIKTGINNILSWLEGFFNSLLEWFNALIDAITSIPSLILQGIRGLLEWLFVPSDISISSFIISLEGILSDRYGLLSYPIVILFKFFNNILSADIGDPVLSIPMLKFNNYTLLEPYSINLNDYIRDNQLENIYYYYRIVTNFIMIIAVLNLIYKKTDEILRGN